MRRSGGWLRITVVAVVAALAALELAGPARDPVHLGLLAALALALLGLPRAHARDTSGLEHALAVARYGAREARAAREEAEAASHTKSSFLAMVSHELRSPMTSILGFCERLSEPDLTEPERQDAIATIRRNGEHLLQLVQDVLDLSKIEAGKLGIERVPCSLPEVVRAVHAALAARAAEKGLALSVRWAGRVPARVVTDPFRLTQILVNLLGNAIKFTERGRVDLDLEYRPAADPGRDASLVLRVEDTGIGMAAQEIARIFRPFTQGEPSTTRRFGGTGLGLSICKHLVEAQGGEIRVQSRKGQGTVFTLWIEVGTVDAPLVDAAGAAPAPPANRARDDAHALAGLRLLVAEDSADSRRLLRLLLERAGATVELAADGEVALDLALDAHARGVPFDAVLMDMQMPHVDGYEAARRLRAAGYRRPIVALTAHALASDRAKCLAAGCDDYCTKPIRREALLATVGRWRPDHGATPAAVSADRAPAGAAAGETDEDLRTLVRQFVGHLEGDVEAMRAALGAEDWQGLGRLAHRLKGTAGSYGFPEITRQAAQLETAVRGCVGSTGVAGELERLAALCRVVPRD